MSDQAIILDHGCINDEVTAKNILDVLSKHYPGHLWDVVVDGPQGIATVRNVSFGGRWGFYLKLDRISATDFDHKVMLAGGELLERYRQRRGAANHEAIDELPSDLRGNAIPILN